MRDDRLLLALGVLAGVAAQTKFQVLLLCAVLVASVLAVGPRALLRTPVLWVGALLGGLIAAPTLLWQAANGWPQLQMGPIASAEAEFLYGGRPGVAILLVLVAGVAGVFLGGYGLWRLLRTPEHRFLAVTFLALLAFFVVTSGRPYYLGGLYGVLAAAGAVGLQRRREAGRLRWTWTAWPAYAVSAAAAAAVLAASVPATAAEAGRGIARDAVTAYASLTAEEQQRTAVLGQSYVYAAFLDGYGDGVGDDLPPAYSTNRAYGWFPPPPENQDAALYVGPSPDELRSSFGDVRPAGENMWVLTGRTTDWATIWAERRNLVVS